MSEFRTMGRLAREAYFRLTRRWSRMRRKHFSHRRHRGDRRKP